MKMVVDLESLRIEYGQYENFELKTRIRLATGNGKKKLFPFPHRMRSVSLPVEVCDFFRKVGRVT